MKMDTRTGNKVNINISPWIDLAELCRELRNKLGLTQVQMANLLETDRNTYRRWEAGEFDPNGQATARLLDIKSQLTQLAKSA